MLDYNSLDMRNVQLIIINCTLRMSKDQPEDGPTIGPKHVAGIITEYNLILSDKT